MFPCMQMAPFFLSRRALASACLGLVLAAAPSLAQTPIGTVVAADAKVQGSVVLTAAGTRVMSGSSVTAGENAAVLKLARGGEVHICPRSSISLANSQSGRDLVLGMNAGVIETNYALGSSADTIMTPDFRILLAGPGVFNFAVGADTRGNTCVRSLDGSTGSILVTEQMGDGVLQVRPGEQAYLRGGSVANPATTVPPDCGCPVPIAVRTAEVPQPSIAPSGAVPSPNAPVPTTSTTPTERTPEEANSTQLPANSAEALLLQLGAPTPVPNPLITSPDNQVHVQVDVPFVFRGDKPAEVPPPPTIASLKLAAAPPALMDEIAVLPPPRRATVDNHSQPSQSARAGSKPVYRKVFGRIRSFFASIFK